jgi:dolichol-phosphate mannosyltransferase
MGEARGDVFVVMDADLQHPPEVIPGLIGALEGGAEFALGSRYTQGGSTANKWTLFRKVNSWVATVLARPFAGRVADPMSGFFALRRSTFERGTRLAPLGYKIGLELMCKCRVGSVLEVPIHFAARAHGQSKLTVAEQFRYLEHLSRLYDFTFPRLAAYAKFAIVVGLGWACGWAVTRVLVEAGAGVPAAIAWSYLTNVVITAAFHLRYVRVQRQFLVVERPWGAFWVTCLAEWVGCGVAAWWLWEHLRAPGVGGVFVLAYGVTVVVRYIMRKELGQDLRGLRRELRREEVFSR